MSFSNKNIPTEGWRTHPVVKSFLSGAFSGFCSTVLFQPFDLVKTRLQTPSTSLPTPPKRIVDYPKNGNRQSISFVIKDVVATDGVKGLWRGVTPSLARTVPGVGLYFGLLHGLKTTAGLDHPGGLESFVLGASSRLLAASFLMPFTVIKARYESGRFRYAGVARALMEIGRTEGWRGLWSGMMATALRDAPYSGLYLTFYNGAKELAKRKRVASGNVSAPLPTDYFICSLFAGFLASAATQPPDVIKTQMQVDPSNKRGFFATAVFIHRNRGGLKGFFIGFIPRATRRTLMAATAWTVYEHLMARMGLT